MKKNPGNKQPSGRQKSRRPATRKKKPSTGNHSTTKACYPCDFNMADMESVDPWHLMNPKAEGDELNLQKLVLALALAYNDLKGIQYAGFQLSKFTPTKEKNAKSGNFFGLHIQILRNLCGFVHELLELVEKANVNKGGNVLRSPLYQSLVSSMESEYRTPWEAVVNAATAKTQESGNTAGPESGLRKQLHRLRNKCGYHWDPHQLDEAYKQFFINAERSPYNAAAYFSLGVNLEASRFFFADAAAEQLLRDTTGESLDFWLQEFQTFCSDVNTALMGIIKAFIRFRRQTNSATTTVSPPTAEHCTPGGFCEHSEPP